MDKLSFKFINQSGGMVIADPCVIKDTLDCIEIDRVRKGVWCVDVEFTGLSVTKMKAVHEDARIMQSTQDEFNIEVQSEQIGFFDMDDYRNDKVAMAMPRENYKTVKDGDKWYCAMAHITNTSTFGAGSYSHGALAEIDNGYHKVYARKSIDNYYTEFEIK